MKHAFYDLFLGRYVHLVRLGESHHAPCAGNQERQERPAR